MKKLFLLVFTITALIACASTPIQMYRPAGSTEPAWQITGEYNEFTDSLEIFINNTSVMSGHLSFFGREAELSGQYMNKSVTSSCFTKQKFLETELQCIVFIEGERAATLQF